MPSYDYQCEGCDRVYTLVRKIKDVDQKVMCENCPDLVCRRVILAAPVVTIDARHEAVPTTRKD